MGTKYKEKLAEEYHERIQARLHADAGSLPVQAGDQVTVGTQEEVQEFHVGRLHFGSKRAGKIRVVGAKVIVRIGYYSKKTMIEIMSEVLAGAFVVAIILIAERLSHWHFAEVFLNLFGLKEGAGK